jgi:hypothetical protein
VNSLRMLTLAGFIFLCFSQAGVAQNVTGSTTLNIDQSSGVVTATCESDLDSSVQAYYWALVNCFVRDSNGNQIASGSAEDQYGFQGYAQVVLTFNGVPGMTYTAIGTHGGVAQLGDYAEPPPPAHAYYEYIDEYNFTHFAEAPQTYIDSYEWYGPGPETPTRVPTIKPGFTEAMGMFAQIPTSLKVLSVTVLPTGTTGNSGCAPGADYGIKVDITYQVLDQAGSAISKSGMKPLEVVQFAGGSPAGPNPIGPTGNSNSSATTANNGTFHDVPFGLCSPSAITNATQLQIIYIDSVQQKVRQNAVTYNSSSSGHGSMSNGGDLDTSR